MGLPVALREVIVGGLVAHEAAVEVLRGVDGVVAVVGALGHPDVGVVVVEAPLLVGTPLGIGHRVEGRGPRAAVDGVALVLFDIYPAHQAAGRREHDFAEDRGVLAFAEAAHMGFIYRSADKVIDYQEGVGGGHPCRRVVAVALLAVLDEVLDGTGAVPRETHSG